MEHSMRNETTGYHLFLEPTGALKEELETCIHALAHIYGGPTFPPHVTFAGPLNESEEVIRAKVEHVAQELTPFTLTLGALSGEDAFFRACYIRIEESAELMRAHALLEPNSSREYTPHLSLFYGNIDDAERAVIMREISYPAGATFTVDRIHIYRTEGTADAWEKVGEQLFR
jgi:2'-5' RNA ligase